MTVSSYLSPGRRPFILAYNRIRRPLMRFGHMVAFFFRALSGIPVVLRQYSKEFLRHLSDIAWGNGSLVVGGGTAGVALVLGVTAGALVAIESYNFLDLLGLGPATGIISSLASTRELAPIMASLAFAMQAGCRFTAQLGSMRIAEEIDAMDSVAIRPIPFLVTTRLMAAIIAVIPLYLACLAISYVSCQVMVGILSGGSVGSYLHYFGIGSAASTSCTRSSRPLSSSGSPQRSSATTAFTPVAVPRVSASRPGTPCGRPSPSS
ncbi:Putative YrbE family protein [Mycobacteroides abscessus]|nr:Putative YrbE family protein [Mycobacteroides abscessus]